MKKKKQITDQFWEELVLTSIENKYRPNFAGWNIWNNLRETFWFDMEYELLANCKSQLKAQIFKRD